jgi:peptidoglycan/LPS O-acetylase OafA/YrhL
MSPCPESIGSSSSDLASNLDSRRLIGLDLIRGLSALLVCFDHVAHFYIDESKTELPQFVTWLFLALKHSGGFAVMVFFVLSGYLVGGSVISKYAKNTFRFRDYFIDRLSRLWVVLIPALIVTVCWDFMGKSHAGMGGYLGAFREVYGSGPSSEYPADNSISCFFGNLGFVQNIFTSIYGSNGPLWSLAYEWWYYVLFPLFYVGFRQLKSRKKMGGLYVLLGAAIFILMSKFMQAFFLVWCSGVFAYLLKNPSWECSRFLTKNRLAVTSLLAISLVFYSFGYPMNNFGKLLFGLCCAGLIPLFSTIRISYPSLEKTVVFLSDISFSLYLFHYPVILFCAFYFGKGNRVGLNWSSFLIAFLFCLSLVMYSIVFWYFFERRTYQFKGLIKKHLCI